MQYSSVIITVLAASVVNAQSATHSAEDTKETGKSNSTAGGKASPTGSTPKATGTARGNSTNTTTGPPVQVSGNSADSLMSQGGGMVTIAGLGVAFALFM
ncbi:hypothetical protein ONS95_004801 [Cadophora gregata]|uniref:uncharacterized protein n=1 Tax=Cadophora gregata TaxID=51156 RepID=UPI0026DC7D93|nr:uncharacterized protein ONS95_004801 [Cadophora gregata]KAK0104512.1 hypothetical protein ONS95_004801 [Cadophora gregata]KAK0115395.1 hypothetical protein ONS96_013851 [Cadophora gregata f. sp. sojae]